VEAARAVNRAREQVAAVVSGEGADVIFTSGATESNNLAILGLAAHGEAVGRRHIISTQIEHHAVLEPLAALGRRGFDVTFLAPNSGGWIEPEKVRAALRPDTLLVSVMHVNNETGVIQPLGDICRILEEHEAYFHTDAAQGFGKELDLLRSPRIDLISASGHKIYGPKGIGALVMRKRKFKRPPLAALSFGGGQERGLRPGTLPVHLVVGLGLAAELSVQEHAHRSETARSFKEHLLRGLAPLNPVILGDQSRTLPTTLNFSLVGIDSEAAIIALKDIVAISNGSACTSVGHHLSHVLRAMEIPAAAVAGAMRWSWCHSTPRPDPSIVRDALKRLT
jgi:cysteine desulfurase